MNADYRLIGRQIAKYRHRVGLTQEQLAEGCDLSVSHLNRIENGRKKASLDVLITIADILTDCSSTERILLVSVVSAVKGDLYNL